ncbi:MAG: UDP-2,3-diacylglucosamine diphosphatase [Gemmatimonadaceae bacterium]
MRVLPTPALIISDIHLGLAEAGVERRLIEFIRAVHGQARTLVINGDLFDFWFEWGSVVPRSAFRTLTALADAREAGIHILWIAGNHDCWGGDILRHDVGVDYHIGPWQGWIGDWRTLLDHGDGLRPTEDRRYRALRRLLRHPAAIAAFRWLPADLATRLASRSSHASRTAGARDGGAGLRGIALKTLDSRPDLDLVVYGHSHVAALERAQSGGIYANAGSWLTRPTFLRLTHQGAELREWDGSPEGQRLDAVDRRPQKPLP